MTEYQIDVAEKFAPGAWTFDAAVVAEFDAHVAASVPFYNAIQDLVAEAADWLAPDGARVVDLGAATGETLARIATRHPERRFEAIVYDQEPAMLAKAKAKLEQFACWRGYQFESRPIEDGLAHRDADLTLALFTLQFLDPDARTAVLAAAKRASRVGGALIVAEKIRPADVRWAEISNEVSWDWKAAQGITDAAIRAKARALRGVLRPSTLDGLVASIVEAGWAAPEVLFRWHNWTVLGSFAPA